MAISITEPSATLPNGTISRFVPVHNPVLFTITSGSTSIKIDIHRTDASPSIINTNDLIFLAGTDFTFVFDASPYVKSILNNDLDITYTADATKEDTEGVLPFYIVVTEYPEASPIVSETSNTFYGVNSVLQIQNRYGNNQGNYLVDDNADVANVVDFLIGSNRFRYWIGYPFSLPYLNNDVTTTAINIEGELVFTTSIADSVNHYILSLQTEGARNIYLQSLLSFSSVWNTANAGSDSDQIVLPLITSGSYNFVVDWGDGNQDTITAYNQAEVTHTYTTSGTKGLNIIGTIQGWQFNNTGDKEKLLSISNWGSLDINNSFGFYGCSNLTLTTVAGSLTLSSANSANAIFRACTSLTTINNLDQIDTSSCTNFSSMFRDSTSFNQDCSSFNIVNATTLSNIFRGCTAYNNGGVELDFTTYPAQSCNFEGVFRSSAFNQSVNNWDISSAGTIARMFQATPFNNGEASGASTSPVTWTMGSNFTNMVSTFNEAIAFNQSLNSWNVTNVTDMSAVFANTDNFNNGGLALTWTMGTSLVTATSMFQGATAFNAAINNTGANSWSAALGSVTNTDFMLSGALVFNQDIGSWDLSSITSATNMLDSCGMVLANYDLTLIGWEVPTTGVTPSTITIGVTGLSYTIAGAGGTARAALIADHSWSFVGDSGV